MNRKETILIIGSLVVIGISPLFGILDWSQLTNLVLWQIRLPRIINGILVGATLSLSGCAFQHLFSNSLATPSTTGTTAGASLGVLMVIVLLPEGVWQSPYILVLFAFLGAIAISLPLALLATRPNIRIEDVLLAGIACTLATGALTTGLQFQADMSQTYRAVQWSLGSLSTVGYRNTIGLLIPTIVSLLGLYSQRRSLLLLLSGEEMAWNQGVDIPNVRAKTIVYAALGVGASVAWCGPIAFVGLLVPHMVKLFIGQSGRLVFRYSPIVGGAFLVCCDSIGRIALDGVELPVGVITAGLGAPLLISLVISNRRKQSF